MSWLVQSSFLVENELTDFLQQPGFLRVLTSLLITVMNPNIPMVYGCFGCITGTMSQMEMWTPKGYILSKRHRKVLARFREAPFVSPFSDFRDLEPLKIKFEKHAVAGMQELLNLTLHKNLVLSSLAELKTEFSFSNKPLDLVLRHPEYFYVSPVGEQETVFLRSAYRNGELARRSSLASIREQLAKLLGIKKI